MYWFKFYLFNYSDNNWHLCFVQVPCNLCITDLFIVCTRLIIIYYKTCKVLIKQFHLKGLYTISKYLFKHISIKIFILQIFFDRRHPVAQ